MSRRKQSNPKPLKRKAEDEELEELGEQLGLPRDVLTLGEAVSEQEDSDSSCTGPITTGGIGTTDYSVQAAQKLREGEQFGPYAGQVLRGKTRDEDIKLEQDSVPDEIKTRDVNGVRVRILLKDVKSRWLKLTKSSSNYHSANFSIYTHGDQIWCRVNRDLEVEAELRTNYEGEKKFSAEKSEHSSSHLLLRHRNNNNNNNNNNRDHCRNGRTKIRRRNSSGSGQESAPSPLPSHPNYPLVNGQSISPKRELTEEGDEGSSPSPTLPSGQRSRPESPHSEQKHLVNGDIGVARKVKRERVSPGPNTSSPPPPTSQPATTNSPTVGGPLNAAELKGGTSVNENAYPGLDTPGVVSAFPPYGFQPAVPPGNFVYVPFLSNQQMSPRPSSVSSVSSDQNEPKTLKAGFNCTPCGITFSTLRTLHAHQSFYCAHRTINLKSKNDDGTESENAQGRPKSRNHYSPRTRRPAASMVVNQQPSEGTGDERSQPAGHSKDDPSISDASNASETKSFKAGKTYACNFCDYVTDRKGGLTRHVRTHGLEAQAMAAAAGCGGGGGGGASPDRVSPNSSGKDTASSRYCANCEIQFSSQKNYQVHKNFYCNTRHVHKPTTPVPAALSPSTVPGTSQQPNIYETMPNQVMGTRRHDRSRNDKNMALPIVLPQPMSPNSGVVTPATGVDPKTGLVFGHPFYAAISTSPLILVPCSYLPGRGITPSSGSLVLPNGSSADDVLSLSPVPAFAVLPNPNNDARGGVATPKVRPLTPKSETDVKLGESSGSSSCVDKPLDLSLRRKADDDVQVDEEKKAASDRTSLSPSTSQLEAARSMGKALPAVVLPQSVVLGNQTLATVTLPNTAASTITLATTGPEQPTSPAVFVKQGTSKCKECNIVFYKHENYLVHKRLYCASRQHRNKRSSTSSPENGSVSPTPKSHSVKEPGRGRRESNAGLSPARSFDSSSSPGHSPKSLKCPSPGSGTTATPSNQIPAGLLSQGALIYQFYCRACNIKFTSLDNLRAHQTYYCPQRAILTPPGGLLPGGGSVSPGSPRGEGTLRCPKCKIGFPTEESLRGHPCASQRKCPYCHIFCPTLSAIQRHLVTHTGVKAFRCTLCGYKGHTVRGMRTHVRIHLDSSVNTPEENFIVCVGEDGVAVGKTRKQRSPSSSSDQVLTPTPPPTTTTISTAASNATGPSGDVDSGGEATKSPGLPGTPNPDEPPNLPDGGVHLTGPGPEVQHFCQYCGYTSSYKGNVVRHIKLVHRDIIVSPPLPGTEVNSPEATSRAPLLDNHFGTPHRIPPAPTLAGPDTTAAAQQPVSLVVVKKENASSPSASNASDSDHSNDSRVTLVTEQMDNASNCSEGQDSPRVRLKEEESSSSSSTTRPLSPALPGQAGQEVPDKELGAATKKHKGSKFCKACNISFKYLSNFVAHKKFYCTPQLTDTVVNQESAAATV